MNRKTRIFLLFILILPGILFAVSSKGQQKSPDIHAVTIPLGGNTYITNPQKEGRKNISEKGITQWSDPKTIFSAYFRTAQSGSLCLYLKYKASAPGKIKLSCGKKSFIVDLRQGEEIIDYVGCIEQVDSGYIRIDLQGLERKAKTYAEISSLIVEGSAVEGATNFVNDFSFYWGRRGPSVHLRFSLPANKDIEWFYNEITVLEGEDPEGSYYMANGFAEGYFGIQVNSATERRVLFSVWSPYSTDNPNEIPEDQRIRLLARGKDVRAGAFGNEGSGGQSYLIYPWKTGNTYRFLTRVKPDGKGSTEYTSYFYTPDEQRWLLIASFSRPHTNTYYKSAYSFVENFNQGNGYLSRKALFNNQWARTKDGEWIYAGDQAKFSVDNTGRQGVRMDYKGGIENNAFFLQNGGFFSDYTPPGSVFNKPGTGIAPNIEFDQLPVK